MSASPPERNDPLADGTDAVLETAALRPEERQYLEEHTLRKPMGTVHIWSLGVGAVITGEYFGWNGGLGVAGPIGMLLASLFVCALYMTWVLALSELSVAMPFAGGPLAYGRRAVGPWLGFVMGWSMFLECLFATIGTAIATGGYIYFILSLLLPETPKAEVTTFAALVTVGLFGLLQWIGATASGEGDGMDDLRRDLRARLVLDRLHSGSRHRTHSDEAAADGWLARRDQGDSLRHLVAGDHRIGRAGGRGGA